jgi:[protein-PII] uridylyltransferase
MTRCSIRKAPQDGTASDLDRSVLSSHPAFTDDPSRIWRVHLIAHHELTREIEKELLRSRPVPAPPGKRSHVVPTVSFDGQASDTATLIEVVAGDRPGLLYALTSAIASVGANIEVVLIDTEAHKAIDVLYVTWAGKKLAAEQQATLRERLIAACRA